MLTYALISITIGFVLATMSEYAETHTTQQLDPLWLTLVRLLFCTIALAILWPVVLLVALLEIL
jgi:uncharacterized membrane protein